MANPRISVVLPIYEREPHLLKTLSSLDRQSFNDFEVIVITEDIHPETDDVLKSTDFDIIELRYEENRGLSGALNYGIEHAKGDYIARIDADDIALPDRFENQIATLQSNPDIGVLGGGYERIDRSGTSLGVITPNSTHLGIRWRLLLTSCIPHPTAMIRRSVLEETGIRYRPEFNAAEDYDLWTRLAPETKLRNLNEPLIKYRIAGDRKSERDAAQQRRLAESIATRTVDRDLPEADFSKKDVIDMQSMLYGGASERIDKKSVSEGCFDLLRQFKRKYGDPGVPKEVSRDFSVTLARSILRPPLQTDSLDQLVKLLSVDPGYPTALASFLLKRRTRF